MTYKKEKTVWCNRIIKKKYSADQTSNLQKGVVQSYARNRILLLIRFNILAM